jgi:hypothetical protein
VITRKFDVFDLTVLFHECTEDELVDSVRDVALRKSVRCNVADRIDVGSPDENLSRHFCDWRSMVGKKKEEVL